MYLCIAFIIYNAADLYILESLSYEIRIQEQNESVDYNVIVLSPEQFQELGQDYWNQTMNRGSKQGK